MNEDEENIIPEDENNDGQNNINPEKAFEETKRALLLISSRLNQTNEYTSQFSKFEESQKNLKKN